MPAEAVYLAWRLPARGTRAFDALDLFFGVLGHGQTSRLHRALVRDAEVAESAGAASTGLIGGNSFGYAYARARGGQDLAEVEEALVAADRPPGRRGPDRRPSCAAPRRSTSGTGCTSSPASTAAPTRSSEYATLEHDPELVNTPHGRGRRRRARRRRRGRRRVVRQRPPRDPGLPEGLRMSTPTPRSSPRLAGRPAARRRRARQPGRSRSRCSARSATASSWSASTCPASTWCPPTSCSTPRSTARTATSRAWRRSPPAPSTRAPQAHPGEEFAELLETEGAGFGIEVSLSGLPGRARRPGLAPRAGVRAVLRGRHAARRSPTPTSTGTSRSASPRSSRRTRTRPSSRRWRSASRSSTRPAARRG